MKYRKALVFCETGEYEIVLEDYVVRCDCGNTYVHNADNLEC